ncbi:MAG: hypothetical protein QE487_14650 [Fluviicola sp.]|nr:hypothetical protein [Fluviicola sp.]
MEYDATKLSEENRARIVELEHYLRDSVSPTHHMLADLVDSKLDRLHFKYENSELVMLVNHPNAQIRYHFLFWYKHSQLKSGSSAFLFDYLKHYISDPTEIQFRSGCIIGEIQFYDECYDQLYHHLTPAEQLQIRIQLVENGLPLLALQSLIQKLPKSDSSYNVLEKLIYEKHQVMALRSLLSYKKEKDITSPYLFLPDHREDAQYAMISNFHPSYKHYLLESIPDLIDNTWSNDAYGGYASLINKCPPEEAYKLIQDVLCYYRDDHVYISADFLYTVVESMVSEAERDSFALILLPSLIHPDTALVNHLRTHYPRQFEQKLEQRLLLVHDAYEDYMYDDSTFARFMLRDYTAQKSEHKTAIYRKLVGFSYGPVLIEAVLQLRETHREEIALILEQRHAELVKLQTVERPYLTYEPYGLTLEEMLWMQSIQKAMVYLNDESLIKRISPVIAGYLGNPGSGTFDDYSKILLKKANDPILYEQMLRKIETQPYEFTYNLIVEFLLDLYNESYKQRLQQRYSELKKTNKSDNLYRFENMLESEQ